MVYSVVKIQVKGLTFSWLGINPFTCLKWASLVTTCRLLNSSRSDDNPNGFTIEGFTIIENKDLQTIKR